MSYCRWGEADVYVFHHVNGYLCCCGCPFETDLDSFYAASTQEMIEHLWRHQEQGHDVPDYVFDDLRADDAENFPHGEVQPYSEWLEAREECKRLVAEKAGEDSTE